MFLWQQNMENIKWNIGCSGFLYKDWKGEFYPEGLAQSKWFNYYASQFNTLELNVTFYRFPQLKTLENWYAKSPETFKFSIKVPRLITHYKQLHETEQLLADFYAVVKAGLKEKLGPVIFQFPPKFIFTEERLNTIIKSLDPSYLNVVEFRDKSWWQKDIIDELSKHHITFCGSSFPNLPDDAIINTPIVYYRFHGVPKLYFSAYETAFLQQIANTISTNKQVKETFIYFNNTATMAAIENAKELGNLLDN